MEPIQKVEGLVTDLKKTFDAFQEASEDNVKKQNEATETRLNGIVDKFTGQFEKLQSEHQKLQAVVERVGTVKADDQVTPEQNAANDAFVKLMKFGKDALTVEERKSLSTDVNPNGGYLVPVQQAGIINGRIFETSPLRGFASVVKTSAKSISYLLDDDESDSGWAGEGDTPSETDTPELGEIEIACHKQYAYPKMTEELIQDAAFDVQSWLNGKLVDKFSRVENSAFVSGNGTKQPRGFLTYNAWGSAGVYERNKIEQVVSGNSSAVTEAGLIDLQASLKEGYQGRARWYMNRKTFAAIMKLNGTSTYRFLNMQPTTGPNGLGLGLALDLMGKPLTLLADMPDIASNALALAYGDMSSAYTIVDRVGISVRPDPYTSPGFVKYYATKRVGGQVTNFEALKLQKIST